MADNFELKFRLDDGGLARQIQELNKHLKSMTATTSKLTKEEKQLVESQKKLNNEVKKSGKNTKKSNEALKLHRKEHRLLKAELAKTNRTFKDIGITQKTVSASFQGSTVALSRMRKAMSLMRKEVNVTNAGFFNITNGGRLLDNSFATIRSKLLLVSFAFGLVTNSVVRQVKMFAEQENSVIKLARVFGSDAANSLAQYSTEIQKTTRFGDELVNNVLAIMGSFGASANQAKKLTTASIDLAEGLGVDLNSAAILIAKSFGSSTNALGRYGIAIDSTLKGQERLQAITGGVESKFKELGVLMGQTTSGQLDRAANSFGDLQERMGEALAPAVLTFANTLKFMADAIPLGLLKFFASTVSGAATSFITYKLSIIATNKATKIGALFTTLYSKAIGKATKATKKFNKMSKKNVFIVLASVLLGVVQAIASYRKGTQGLTADQEQLRQKIDEVAKTVGLQSGLNSEEIQAIAKFIQENDKKIANIQAEMTLKGSALAIRKKEIELGRELTDIERASVVSLQNQIDAQKELKDQKKQDLNLEQTLQSAFNQTSEGQIASLQNTIDSAKKRNDLNEDELKGLAAIEAKLQNVIIKTNEWEFASVLRGIQTEIANTKRLTKDFTTLTDEELKKLLEDDMAFKKFGKSMSMLKMSMSSDDEKKAAEDIEKLIEVQMRAGATNIIKDLKAQRDAFDELDDAMAIEADAKRKGIVLTAKESEEIQKLTQEIHKKMDAEEAAAEKAKKREEAQKLITETMRNSQDAEIATTQKAIDILMKKHSLSVEEAAAVTKLKERIDGLKIARKNENNQLLQQIDNYAAVGNAILSVGRVAGMSEKSMLALQVVMATANAYKAASDTWADTSIQPTILRGAVAASHFAAAYAQVRGIQNQMQKVGAGGGGGDSGPIGSFEYGGMVGGQRHSQGGTIIEAERGEFVMSRNAVESIGVETLNQMNQGGSTGNVVINVSGNVMTQDFVEDELAESIKEAVRKGSDFGLN